MMHLCISTHTECPSPKKTPQVFVYLYVVSISSGPNEMKRRNYFYLTRWSGVSPSLLFLSLFEATSKAPFVF